MELVCPAGNLPALKTALSQGADAVYIGFADHTNARHFAGLNFNPSRAAEARALTKAAGKKLFVAINTYAQADRALLWRRAVDCAADLAVDALIVSDIGVLAYASSRHPELPLHLSVQASATSHVALNFYHQQFNIRRAVLPRVLSLKQVQQIAGVAPVPLEVFGFGSLCIMAEGRCHLSSYLTGESPNMQGVCSPARAVQWRAHAGTTESRLNGVLIDTFAPDEAAGYPTLCKGRFQVQDQVSHAIEEPTSLNTLAILLELRCAGISAIKLEGRQRSPAYVSQVVATWREALDALKLQADGFTPESRWLDTLRKNSEGRQTTLGAYDRPWQ